MKPEGDDSDWKYETASVIGNTRGTNLEYGMLCEPISSDNKERHKLSGNLLVNLQTLTTEKEKFE